LPRILTVRLDIVEQEEKLKGNKKMEGFAKVLKAKETETKRKYRYFDKEGALFRTKAVTEFAGCDEIWNSIDKTWERYTGDMLKPMFYGMEVPENEINKDWPGAV
jgi:hypothetical protein